MKDASHGSTQEVPDELRERATRIAVELRQEALTRRGAIPRVAEQLGLHPETLRGWVRQAEIAGGVLPDTTSAHGDRRILDLEDLVRELGRANHTLQTWASFTAAELDRPVNESDLPRRPSPRP